MFCEILTLSGHTTEKSKVYDMLYFEALKGNPDCGGIVSYNCLSGEPVLDISQGRPMLMRLPNSKLTVADFMRNELYSAFAALKNGNDIL